MIGEDVSISSDEVDKNSTRFGWVLSHVTFTTISENWKLATMVVKTRPMLIGKQ
jgi:hypothetical protein